MARAVRLGCLVFLWVVLQTTSFPGVVTAEEPADPRALAPLLRAQAFDELENRITALSAARARTREGWLAAPASLYALGVATADDPALAASLEAWRRASPRSWAMEMVSGWQQLGFFHPQRASDGSLQNVELWGQPDPNLRAAARAAFERARGLAPQSPEPGAALLGVAILDGTPAFELLPLLKQPCAYDTACETARALMLTGLEPYRGGRADAMLAFARMGARDHPDNPTLGLLVAFAHRKAAIASGNPEKYFRDDHVFAELERAYEAQLAVHPNAFARYNELARAACWAGRLDVARRAYAKIGAAFDDTAWKGDFHGFAKCRQQALEKPARPGPAALAE